MLIVGPKRKWVVSKKIKRANEEKKNILYNNAQTENVKNKEKRTHVKWNTTTTSKKEEKKIDTLEQKD